MQGQVVALLIAAILFFVPRLFAEEKTSPTAEVREGSTVSIEYTVKDESGKVIDSNVGKKPLTVHMNGKEIIPGLEKRMIGMKEGESKEIVVPAKEAYGEVQQDLMITVPLERLPADAKVGDTLQVQTPDGKVFPCKVKSIDKEKKVATIDLNHPLAGQDLTFEVKILKVEK